jgi:large subunit ribosomal protein L25
MVALNAENRNTSLKPRQLRRKGVIPGVLYGKNLKESLSIQFSQAEVARFFKGNSVGSRVELVLGDNKFPALLREATREPATGGLEHLSFQTLLAGEIVTSTARIVFLNREKVTGMVQQPQDEISYRALPSNLIDKIEIDLDGMQTGTSLRISDLDIAKNPDIEILSPLDTMVLSIVEARRGEAPEADEQEPEEE